MHATPPEGQPRRPRSALQNPTTFIGWILIVVAFVTALILMLADFIWFRHSVYNSIITYMIAPGFIFIGVALVLAGYFAELRHRKKVGMEEFRYPRIDLNHKRARKWLLVATALITVFVSISAVGGYQAYHFTESVEFCGQACHDVMVPEYTAYQQSPHARVACVECHIGAGAEWYVKAKLTGLHQVWAYAMDSYELPIDVPVHNLRPARDICEQCHWPSKFSGNFERVYWYFEQNEENTPRAFHLLMKVGGASPTTGRVGGIHWHVSRDEKVEYWSSDEDRTVIPWVRVTYEDGRTVVFASDDAPEGGPPAGEIRNMDCMDCHNRPSHIYYSPRHSLTKGMVAGLLDRHVPNLFATSLDLLSADYETKAGAEEAIAAGILAAYGDSLPSASVETITEELQGMFAKTRFPEQGVDWRTYPNFIGHMFYPGCDRCHDGMHTSEAGEAIRNDCRLCHNIIAQPTGEAAFGPVMFQEQEFDHPGGEGWDVLPCSDCHRVEEPPKSTLMRTRAGEGKAEEAETAG